jgi:hypothetical protein
MKDDMTTVGDGQARLRGGGVRLLLPTALQFRHHNFLVEGHELPEGGKLFALHAGDKIGQRSVQGTDALTVFEPVIEEALNHLSGLILVDFHDDAVYGLRSAARPN